MREVLLLDKQEYAKDLIKEIRSRLTPQTITSDELLGYQKALNDVRYLIEKMAGIKK